MESGSFEFPDEIVSHILSFLKGFEVWQSAPFVCLSWSRMCRNDKLWRFLCEKEFGCWSSDHDKRTKWLQRSELES